MSRRLPAPPPAPRPPAIAWAVATLAALATWSTPSPAASTSPSYTLTAKGTQAIKQVVFDLRPPFVIDAPKAADGSPGPPPLTILPGSSGFDDKAFNVVLGDDRANGQQKLVLLFGEKPAVDASGQLVPQAVLGPDGKPDQGLAPGGVLNFSLKVDPTFQGTLNLLPDPASAPLVSLAPMAPAAASSGSGSTTPVPTSATAVVPEPVTLLIWAPLAAFGLLRARRRL